MTRAYNFSAGPAVLPESVLRQAADEMLDWHGSGMSVMEMSHRGKEFMSILAQAKADLAELLNLPSNYKILFLQGGGVGMNGIIPMNLLGNKKSIDVINTGSWASKSLKEAKKYARANEAATSEPQHFTCIPPRDTWKLDPEAAYVHICSNETIGGVQYHWVPDTGDVPIVADMSSDILSRPIDVSRYGLIFAGAQKNMGPSGMTLVLVRDDLLGRALPITPNAFDFKQQADNDSMLNTPPTYAIYIAGLVYQWLKEQGGLAAMEAHNRKKAALLYDLLDATPFYTSPVARSDRSLMNVPFTLPTEELTTAFLKGAQERGMVQLKGHSSVGGIRASIYNAMPIEGVQVLAEYMKDFAARHG
ncbi:3-phosphoserine/phosphohydroxythreonine transaminase [Rhizobacter sp. J219]|jgi:phosphoserine aminotransferase|uniref:3-phosphoserine/phosphohydroxythreonine transaminase n=1 Tax=Rhizobacter sp. J219 TaxID=2898430 RepID=UPI002151237D|nr:3-phosphoserine/phosphohydroxythreonine transaminase [Rhizobacter sp. J219]MCR5883013.1 3-phosphoserine/phosphohydroxythreonine transaminase [Rhizobacter sp. J219]